MVLATLLASFGSRRLLLVGGIDMSRGERQYAEVRRVIVLLLKIDKITVSIKLQRGERTRLAERGGPRRDMTKTDEL